jgi:hypothetical protein
VPPHALVVATPGPAAASPWSLPRRLAFRFGFAYGILYLLPFPVGALPLTGGLARMLAAGRRTLVPWFGRHVLHLKAPAVWHETGSGDSLYEWVSVLLIASLAAVATTVWSLVSRQSEHRRLHQFLRIYVRYALALIMLGYGLTKVFPGQFPAIDPPRLMEPYGQFSPMGALWAFMGASAPYTVAAGLAETIGGLLLFFRRTTAVGALLLLAVLGNVVLLNFCYDVPVKLYSSHLWLMALFLAGSDLRTVYDVLVRRRPVQPPSVDWRPRERRWRIAARVGQGLFASWLVFGYGHYAWNHYREYGNGRVVMPVEGIWEVDEIGAGPSWHRIGLGQRTAAVATAEEPYTGYRVEYDSQQSRLTLQRLGGTTTFAFRLVDRDHLVLDGPFAVRLHRQDPKQIWLTGRGFHWVQEYPLNR